MILSQAKISNNVFNSTQSYYMSDSGTEASLYKLKNGYSGSFDSGTVLPKDDLFSSMEGDYSSVILGNISGTTTLRIKTIGSYKRTSRNIEIAW